MAQLNAVELSPDGGRWTAAQTRSQYAAIASLRWRIFRNGLRRKGTRAEAIIAWALILPIFLGLSLGTATGAGLGAYFFASAHHLERISWILWAIFAIAQLININLGQPGTSFDPTQLIRFPLNVRSYIAVRLFFGVLSPSNIIMVMASFAVAMGIIVAMPSLWVAAILALLVFALTNILFTRMIFTWVDRWLSTRRAREVFTGIIFTFSLGVQYLNATFNPGFNAHHKHAIGPERLAAAAAFYAHATPILARLPPGLIGNAFVAANASHPGIAALDILGCALFATLFLAIFALRIRIEFRGENISDQANSVAKPRTKPAQFAVNGLPSRFGHLQVSATAESPAASATASGTSTPKPLAVLTPQNAITGMLGKEFLYLRRNTGLFYGFVAPLVMVLIFAGKFATRSNSSIIFPAALAYAMLGVVPLSFNSFGLDATGTQFYFLAPVRIREILIAKNIMNIALMVLEVVAIFALVSYIAAPPSPLLLLNTLLWAAAVLFTELTVGNYRSISTPKKVEANRTAQKQASPMSALLSMGILLASAAIGYGLLFVDTYFHLHWLPLLVLLALAAAAIFTYLTNLNKMDHYALTHRDSLFEELCKKS